MVDASCKNKRPKLTTHPLTHPPEREREKETEQSRAEGQMSEAHIQQLDRMGFGRGVAEAALAQVSLSLP